MKKLYSLLETIVDLDVLIDNGRFEYSFFGEPSFNMHYMYEINGEIFFTFFEYDLNNEVDPDGVLVMNPKNETARVVEFSSNAKTVNWYTETNTERFIRHIREKLKKTKKSR